MRTPQESPGQRFRSPAVSFEVGKREAPNEQSTLSGQFSFRFALIAAAVGAVRLLISGQSEQFSITNWFPFARTNSVRSAMGWVSRDLSSGVQFAAHREVVLVHAMDQGFQGNASATRKASVRAWVRSSRSSRNSRISKSSSSSVGSRNKARGLDSQRDVLDLRSPPSPGHPQLASCSVPNDHRKTKIVHATYEQLTRAASRLCSARWGSASANTRQARNAMRCRPRHETVRDRTAGAAGAQLHVFGRG